MNEKFITETHFTKKLCHDFVNYINLHRQIWLYIIILVIISLLEYKNSHSIERVLMFIGAMIIMYFISSFASTFILLKRNGKFLKLHFYEHNMFVETEKKREKISYDTIQKIVEQDKYFYLFFTQNRGAFIVEKAGFSKGNMNKFSDFIKNHLSQKH
ncbi:YcxB family protein [Pectinatus sottacetonis]|uniref:YcxB family protein n=1 Tax=Pectinatus sottacetonis TaxID=1002795 RepID=UPI0018C707B1|nr:YcxB family protein [Pectinatus sottacetonis]